MSTPLRIVLILGCAAILALEAPGAFSVVSAGWSGATRDEVASPLPIPTPFGPPRLATLPAAERGAVGIGTRLEELPPGMPGLAVTALR